MRSLFVIALVAASGGCHRQGSADETTAVVRQFFQYAEAGDCAQLQPLMLKPDECENIVRQFQETKTHLISVDETKVDGRDASARLVYTTVGFSKQDNHKWIVRAARVGDAWKVRL